MYPAINAHYKCTMVLLHLFSLQIYTYSGGKKNSDLPIKSTENLIDR